jgi:FkbM family methyltransferase
MNIVRYLARRLRTIRGLTIVHVGAHTGQEAERYQTWGARRVVWIEAAPDIFARLEAHLADMRQRPPSRFARLTRAAPTEHIAIQALVAADDGAVHELNVYANDGASNSIFLIDRERTRRYDWLHETGEVHRITARRLDTILAEAGIAAETVDILVVDVQGAELLCLKGATRLLRHVRWIESEVSQKSVYVGGVLLHELEPWLAERGFRRRTWMRSNHGNAIFARVRGAVRGGASGPAA